MYSLYDLEDDATEDEDLSSRRPELVDRLRPLLAPYIPGLKRPPPPPVPPEMIRRPFEITEPPSQPDTEPTKVPRTCLTVPFGTSTCDHMSGPNHSWRKSPGSSSSRGADQATRSTVVG